MLLEQGRGCAARRQVLVLPTPSVYGAELAAAPCGACRAQEKRLCDSRLGWVGRSSPYGFALMIFLKEKDSCEQTGLTGTALLHTPGGFLFVCD